MIINLETHPSTSNLIL